jgi:hypothetical protein
MGVNNKFEGMWPVQRYYLGSCLEKLRRTKKNFRVPLFWPVFEPSASQIGASGFTTGIFKSTCVDISIVRVAK